jgi:HlyD family secretion protein
VFGLRDRDNGSWRRDFGVMKKRFIFLGLILIVLTGIIFIISRWASSSELVLEGVVETNIYPHYSEVSGKIIELPVQLGQEVKAGDVLAVLDDSNERFALEQLEKKPGQKTSCPIRINCWSG